MEASLLPAMDVTWWSYIRQPVGCREEESMSEVAASVVLALILCVLIVISYWRQIIVTLLLAVFAVFCIGVYHVLALYYP